LSAASDQQGHAGTNTLVYAPQNGGYMSPFDVMRSEVQIEASARATAKVAELLEQSRSALHTEMRLCRKLPDGGTYYVLICDRERGLDKLLFDIEKVRGAVVHQCTAV